MHIYLYHNCEKKPNICICIRYLHKSMDGQAYLTGELLD